MIKGFRVKPDLQGMRAEMDRLAQREIPAATAIALSRTAKFVEAEIRREIPRVFDRPTRWTLNSLRTKTATKRELWAEVKVKDRDAAVKTKPAIEWLAPEIYSGPRLQKRSEELLVRAGAMLPGYYIVPGAGARLDSHGNVSRGQIQQILSALSAQWDSAQNRKAEAKGKTRKRAKATDRIFAIKTKTGHLAPGVYQRVGQYRLKPLLLYVRRPHYRKRLRFFEIAQAVSPMRFRLEFRRAARYVARTRRAGTYDLTGGGSVVVA